MAGADADVVRSAREGPKNPRLWRVSGLEGGKRRRALTLHGGILVNTGFLVPESSESLMSISPELKELCWELETILMVGTRKGVYNLTFEAAKEEIGAVVLVVLVVMLTVVLRLGF